ncbi:hypothetical protein [Tunturibacter empetritectus]|uniref:Uncharacterized protein n=1 Tax=Tunturiibacter lichenicola TaxID=2051959 RepID=A0A7W8J8V1_9BACT|nr:hypothetical protein [Edaphobacter lichenicola]MBB5344593.1 hypothetical protein [Edaphobacter lichenicola]
MRLFSRLALCFALTTVALGASAQQPSAATITPSADSTAAHNWTKEQILTCTVSDCWQLAGKNEATFFDIVQQLAEISAQTRGLALPESAEAGKRAGEYIKAKAKADHGQLLYAIVDASVRRVGTKASTPPAN